MGYRTRVYVPGCSVHAIRRGINRMQIFFDDADYESYLALLKSRSRRFAVAVHGFALMTNHVHLVVTPTNERGLPRMMHGVNRRYSRYFNKRYDRIGTMWNGRYTGSVIDDERYWLTCLRYVELNPVRANMVDRPESYRWTSYRVHAFGEVSDWLTPHPLYLALGSCDKERQAAYRAICGIPVSEAELADHRLRPAKESAGVVRAPASMLSV
jgi:putative transposase